jgi:hypothetical protein
MNKSWMTLATFFVLPLVAAATIIKASGKNFYFFETPLSAVAPRDRPYQCDFSIDYVDDLQPFITSIHKKSQAYKNGLRAGQKVDKIDGITAAFLNRQQILNHLSATKPTVVQLAVADEKQKLQIEVPLQKSKGPLDLNLADLDLMQKRDKTRADMPDPLATMPSFIKHQVQEGPIVIEFYKGNTSKFTPLTRAIAHINKENDRHKLALIQLIQLDCENPDIRPLLEAMDLRQNDYALFLTANAQEYIKGRDVIKLGFRAMPLQIMQTQLERITGETEMKAYARCE